MDAPSGLTREHGRGMEGIQVQEAYTPTQLWASVAKIQVSQLSASGTLGDEVVQTQAAEDYGQSPRQPSSGDLFVHHTEPTG